MNVARATAAGGRPDPGESGTVLVSVLWVMVILSTVALTLAGQVRVDLLVSRAGVDHAIARSAARSGVAFALAELAADQTPWDGPEDTWVRDGVRFRAVAVEGSSGGTFSLLRDDHATDTTLAFGLADEAAKVNINIASRGQLIELLSRLALPDVAAEEIADAIIDWRDADDIPGAFGAESEYYLTREPSRYAKNAPFETVEELLMVRGIDHRVLYGEDQNQNGVLDANERDRDVSPPSDDGDGELDRGLAAYLPVNSSEPNSTLDGRPRVDLNRASRRDLEEALLGYLDPLVIDAIIAGRPFTSVAQLLDLSGMTPDVVAEVVDLATVSRNRELAGLVNVNTAPDVVLDSLPGIDEATAASIVAHRQSAASLESIGWLLEILSPEQFRGVAELVTTRSCQYTVEAIGVSPHGRGFARVRAVVDRADGTPRITYWREVSSVGLPCPLDVLRGAAETTEKR